MLYNIHFCEDRDPGAKPTHIGIFEGDSADAAKDRAARAHGYDDAEHWSRSAGVGHNVLGSAPLIIFWATMTPRSADCEDRANFEKLKARLEAHVGERYHGNAQVLVEEAEPADESGVDVRLWYPDASPMDRQEMVDRFRETFDKF